MLSKILLILEDFIRGDIITMVVGNKSDLE
jgi:hypothetical protein